MPMASWSMTSTWKTASTPATKLRFSRRPALRGPPEVLHRRLIVLAIEILVERPLERGPGLGGRGQEEQGQAGAELELVGIAEDVAGRAFEHGVDRLDAFDQPRS